jgi:ribosomal protein L12E/L44/L45/RPP1/RPP2
MAIGMTYEQFWHGESGIRRAFRKAYQIRMENEMRISDRNAWNMGHYIREALHTVQMQVAAVPVKKLTDPPEYTDRPYMVKADEERKAALKTEEEERKKKEEDQSKLAMSLFQQMVARMNGNIIRKAEKQKQESTGQ